jgi:hypothetical protein
MTTINEAREAVYERWDTQWGSTTPFTFENEDFDTPDVPWARVSVRNQASEQRTLGAPGNRRFRRIASVFVQIFDLVDNGLLTLDGLSQTARTIFEGVSFSGLDFNNVVVRESGTDGKWYQFVVEAFFDYEETK